jgi:hypothetical protein
MAWAAPLIDCGKPSVTRQKIPVLLRPCRGGNIGSLRRWILPGWPVILNRSRKRGATLSPTERGWG